MEKPDTRCFGRYEIVGELGRGAMGIVYKARDPQIDRLVALKTVSLRGQEPEDAAEFRQRFANEAQAAGRLHHPGIVSVFDVGEETETRDPYIVLEYVDGEALSKLLAREKKLPLARALHLAAEIADALDYAHSHGVTHRDIKPANVLINKAGRAKIADFGIAKLNLAHFTLPGRVLGTPAYMAPEQLSGEGSDGRSDLFSLGVILYAMVAGHSPFQGNSATTVCFKVANNDPVPASALDLNLPHELDAVISRAMAKDPQQRYQTGADFAADLHLLQTQTKAGTTTTSLQALSGTGTQRTGQLGKSGTQRTVLQEAVSRGLLRNLPARDLVLGAASVLLLLVIAVQSKLLVISQHRATDPIQLRTDQARTINPVPTEVVVERPAVAQPPAAPKRPVKKASAKAPVTKSETPAVATEVIVPTSTLELTIRHQFKEATLSVFIDDQLALTRPLHGGTQKKLVVFSGVRGTESETLKVPAGKHTLRFRAATADHTVDLSRTITSDFVGGQDRILEIGFEKRNTAMRLDWQ